MSKTYRGDQNGHTVWVCDGKEEWLLPTADCTGPRYSRRFGWGCQGEGRYDLALALAYDVLANFSKAASLSQSIRSWLRDQAENQPWTATEEFFAALLAEEEDAWQSDEIEDRKCD